MGCCASSPSDQVVIDPQATKPSLVDETAAAATAEKTKKEAEEKEAKAKIDKENKKKEEDAKNAKKKESLPDSSAAKTGDDKSGNNKNDNNNNNNIQTSSEDKYTKFTFNENGDAIDENGNLLRVTTKAAREALKKGISALEHFEEEKSNPRQRSDNAECDDDQAEGFDKLVSRELTQRAQALIMQSHDLKDRYDEHLVRKIREGGQMGTFDTTTATNSDNTSTNVDEDNKTNILLQKQRNQIEQDKNLTDEERKQKLDDLSKKEKRKRRNSAIFPEMVIGDHFSPIVRRVGEVLIEATKENEKLPQEEGKNDDDQQHGDKPAANDNDGNAQSKSKTSSKKSSLQLSNEDRKRKLDIAADLIAASIAQFEDLEMKLNLAEKQQQKKMSTTTTTSKNEKFDDKKLILDEQTGKKYYIDQNSGRKVFVDLEKNTKNNNNNNNGTKKLRGENDDDDDELYDLYYDDEGNPYFLDPKTGNRVYTDDEKKEILVDDGGNCYYLDDDGLRVYTNGCKRDEEGKHYYISKAGEKVYTNVDTIDRSAATPKNTSKQRELNAQLLLVDEKTKKEYFLDEKGSKVFPNVTKDEKSGKKSFIDERTGKQIVVDDDNNQENKTNNKKLLVDEKTGKEYYIDEQTGEKVFPNQFFTDSETKKKYFLDKQGKKVFVESSDNNNNNTDGSNATTKKTETTTVDSNGRKILIDEKTGKQYYSDQNGTKVFPTIKSDAKDGTNKYFIDPKSGKKVLLVTTTTTTEDKNGNNNNNNNKENFVSSPNSNNTNGKNITSPAAKAAAAKFNSSPPSSPTKTANGKKSIPLANKTTSHSPVRLNQLAAESPSPNSNNNNNNNNNGSKFDRNLIIDYSDPDDNDEGVDVDNKNKNKSVNNKNNTNNNNIKNTAMITKNANKKVSFPSDAILRALNGPSFFELASDQPRGSCFVADEALLHCLIHEKKRNQNQEHGENENTTTVSESNNNYILSTVAKCVDRFKKILFNAKVARLMNDDRGGDASRVSNAEEKEQQPSSPGLLSFGKNILGVGNLVGRGGEAKKNFKGNNSCNSIESTTNNSGAAASSTSGPVDDQAPESVIKVKKLLKEFSKNPNPGSDISIQLQRALQDCRKDIESRSASNLADEEKRFIDRILVHNEKIFEMLMMTQPSQQQNDGNKSNNDRKNDNDKKLSQLIDTMSSKISDVDPASISSMTESEKEKVVKQVNSSINDVIYNIENTSENNNNNVSSFSPREGEDESFQNSNNKNIVEGLVAVQEIIRDSVKWFSNEKKSQSIKRMLSFKNNHNNNNSAKSPSSPNSNMNNINNNRATSPINNKTGNNFKPPQQRDALNDNGGKTKSPTSTTANKPASSNNNSPILAGRRSNNSNVSNGNSPTKKSLLQELKENHDKNPSSRNSSVARGKSPPPALKTSTNATSGPTSHPYLQQQLKNKNNINNTNKKAKHDSGTNKIFRPRSATTNNIIASTIAINGNVNDHFRLDDGNHNNSSHHDHTLSYSALSVLPVEALSADQRKAILQSDQTLLKAVSVRISTLTPQQKQHTAQALNKSAEVMDMLKKQIMNYSSQHHQQQQQQNNHNNNGNEFTTAAAAAAASRFSRNNDQNSKSIPELDKVRAILNEVHLGTRNASSSSSADELTPQEQFALAREVIENMQNELDSKLDPANHSGDDIQQKRRDEVTSVLLNHYSDALQLMEQASFSSNASAELAILTNNNNNTHNLAPHPGTATAAAIISLNETLEELRKMVAAKILNSNNNSDSEQQFCDLPVQERTKVVAQAKALIAVGMKKLSPLGAEEQRNILPVFDAITNLLRSVASSASAVALQKQILEGGGANGNPNPINHFSPLLPPAKNNTVGNEATGGGASAGNVLAGRRANNNTSSNNSTPNKLNGIQNNSFGRDSENQNNSVAKAKSMHLMNNTNNELRSSSNNNNNNNTNNNVHGRRAASFSNTNNTNSNISKAKSTILPPRTQKKQGHHIPEMVYTEGDIEESVFSRFVAPVGRIDRFGIGKVNCDLCVEFPSGIARVVVHDSNFSDWSRIKGNALLGQISKAAQDFAAHGGLMQYRTANMVYSESPSRNDTIHTAAEVENEQLKSLNMLQFEKWDWRKAK